MDSFDPVFSAVAFAGVIFSIFGLGWLLKNKFPLGDISGIRSSFDLRGSYRVDSKTRVSVFSLDGMTFYVMISPSGICLLHKSHEDELRSCGETESNKKQRGFSQDLKEVLNKEKAPL